MFRPLSVLTLSSLSVLLGCGSRESPVSAELGVPRLEAMVGPGGGELRGDGSTNLAGLLLTIPPGALTKLVRVRISVGPDLEIPGSHGVGAALKVLVEPDPGSLLRPASLRMRIALPKDRNEGDLVVVNRQVVPGALGLPSRAQLGLAASSGVHEELDQTFTASVHSLYDMQVHLTDQVRQKENAWALVDLAIAALDRHTDEALLLADLHLADAVRADPYDPDARAFRALTRVLVVLNDRRPAGPGLSSLGEGLAALGLDLGSKSLLRRLVDSDWPRVWTPAAAAPDANDFLEMLQRQLRPAVELSLQDLAYVPPDIEVQLALPKSLVEPPLAREVDRADFLFFRSVLATALFAMDFLEDLDLIADLGFLVSSAGRKLSIQEILERYPNLGNLRVGPADRTVSAFVEGQFSLVRGFVSLNGETDPQANDLVVLPASFDAQKRDRWQRNLEQALESLLHAGSRTQVVEGFGVLQLDLVAPWASRSLDPRGLIPDFLKYLPLAGSLPDPSMGGLLPDLTQDQATHLFQMASKHDLGHFTVVVDGKVQDWPKSSEALLPPQAAGGISKLEGLDLGRVFLGISGDDVCCRLSLAEGSVGYHAGQVTRYGIEIEQLWDHPGGGSVVKVEILMTPLGPELSVERDGKPIVVRSQVAYAGRELEFSVNRYDLFEPDDPIRDRILWAHSHGRDPVTGFEEGDTTRRIAIRL